MSIHSYIGNSLDIQAPDYVLPKDHFNITCKGTNPVRIKVHNCHAVRPVGEPLHKEKGEYYQIAYVTHVHVEKPCQVLCFSGRLTETKIISVIGKLV